MWHRSAVIPIYICIPTKHHKNEALVACWNRLQKPAAMDEFQGAMGTAASLGLRMLEIVCSAAGLLFMFSGDGFAQYASFWYVV